MASQRMNTAAREPMMILTSWNCVDFSQVSPNHDYRSSSDAGDRSGGIGEVGGRRVHRVYSRCARGE